MSKKSVLNDIILCCEKRFNRGPVINWKHSDFSELSREILHDTDVNISPNTLKRIFGKISVEDDYFPQQATIDALKKYGGAILPEAGQPVETPNAGLTKSKSPGFFTRHKTLCTVSLLLIIICGLLVLMISKNKSKPSGNITQTGIEGVLPATAFFALQLPNGNDSLFIDFGDKSPLLFVKSGQRSTTHNYLFPGVFKVSLKTGQTTLATVNVSIHSEGWVGLAYPPQGTLPNRYYHFPADKASRDSLFHISNGVLHEVGIDTVGMFYTRLSNFAPVAHSGEDFVFEATFKNALPGKGISCIGTQFQISGLNGSIRFKLVNSGCSYRVINVMSEKTFDGRIENLSRFVVDLQKWNTVRLVNKSGQVTLWVNGKPLFTEAYQNPLGKIQGIFLEFEGNGYIKNCDLKTIDGKSLYHF